MISLNCIDQMTASMYRSHLLPYIALIAALFIILISPHILSDRMFMDGQWYATIARNMAYGDGSFWHLKLTETLYPQFHEHPPMAMGIASLFYSLLGQSYWVDKLYSLAIILLNAYIIILLWKNLVPTLYHSYAWIPLLLWISVPLIFWTATNNMLENTLMLFTHLSVLCLIKSLGQPKIIHLSVAGILLFFGFLTKGFVVFFPLGVYFGLWIIDKNYTWTKMLWHTFLLILLTIIPFVLLYVLMPEGIESIKDYINIQVINSLKERDSNNGRFYILMRLFSELIPAILLICMILVIKRKSAQNTKKLFALNKSGLLMLYIGFSGSLPIMVSAFQNSFYLVPVFSYFVLALATIVVPLIDAHWSRQLYSPKIKRYVWLSALILFTIGLLVSFYFKSQTKYKQDVLSDVYKVMNIVPKHSIIRIPEKIRPQWDIHGYFYRYAWISLDYNNQYYCRYKLLPKGETDIVNLNDKKIDMGLVLYDLYETR
jgi:4-amino-4-deoxy-L-arabinose transferase-like glycosyltransferase